MAAKRRAGGEFLQLLGRIREAGTEAELGRQWRAGLAPRLQQRSGLGLLAAGRYGNNWRNRSKDFRRYEFTGVDGGSTQTVDYEQFTTRQTIDWSGFLNVGIEFLDGHSVQISQVNLAQTDDETQRLRGLSSEDDISDGTRV